MRKGEKTTKYKKRRKAKKKCGNINKDERKIKDVAIKEKKNLRNENTRKEKKIKRNKMQE
jgi:hypothetical protein